MSDNETYTTKPPIRGSFIQEHQEPWQGWWKWSGHDPFEDASGPFFVRRDEHGIVTGFMPDAKNANGHGTVHGGALMTFADYTLFMIGGSGGDEVIGVTVTMNCEFVSAAVLGLLLTGRGECIRAGRSLVFVRGTIFSGEDAVMSFSGTIKRTKGASAH
jgi:acyl-coenzyme A thioesterase PaaI-like protein